MVPMSKKENLLISACLLGLYCRYDGKELHLYCLPHLMEKYNLIPVCPEILGGLGTPRSPVEIRNGRAVDKTGRDVQAYLERGANEPKACQAIRLQTCLAEGKSPSCGNGKIYDGTFSGTLIDGNGITAELLEENGITVYGESGWKSCLTGHNPVWKKNACIIIYVLIK